MFAHTKTFSPLHRQNHMSSLCRSYFVSRAASFVAANNRFSCLWMPCYFLPSQKQQQRQRGTQGGIQHLSLSSASFSAFHTSHTRNSLKLPNKHDTLKSLNEISQKATKTVKEVYNADATKKVGRFAKWSGWYALKGAQKASGQGAKIATSAVMFPVITVYRRMKRLIWMAIFFGFLGLVGYVTFFIDSYPRLMGYWAARNIANAEIDGLHNAAYEPNLKQVKQFQDLMEQHPYEQVIVSGKHASDLVKATLGQIVGVAYVFALDGENANTVFAKAAGPYLEKSLRIHSVEYLAHVLKNSKRWLWMKQKFSRHEIMDLPTLVIHFKPRSSKSAVEDLQHLEHMTEVISKHNRSCRVLFILEDGSLARNLKHTNRWIEAK